MRKLHEKKDIRLYRDDGLTVFKNKSIQEIQESQQQHKQTDQY